MVVQRKLIYACDDLLTAKSAAFFPYTTGLDKYVQRNNKKLMFIIKNL